MAFFDKYPYTDFHEMNLDWLLNKMRELEIEFDEFKVVNNITFSGQWDITKQYPAWTIVSDNNIGYVSIQPVPVGVPLTNGSYWIEVIDYTAQIAGLENRVIAIEDDLNDNVHPDILQNAADIADINHRININERTFLFVGDSYGSQTETWVNPCVQYAGITDYTNLAVTGTSFHDGTFESQITGYTGDRDKVTDIVVGGGLNDSNFNTINSDYTATANGIASFASYAKAQYPNATLWLAFMGNAIDDAPLLSGRTWDKRSWAKYCYADTGKKNNFIIIDNVDEALAYSIGLYKSDHIHPNASGADSIGQTIANALRGLHEEPYYPDFNYGPNPAGNNTFTNPPIIRYSLSDGVFNISISNDTYIKIDVDHNTFTGSTWIDLVTSNNLYFNKAFYISTIGRIDGYNNKTFWNTPMLLKFYQDKISVFFGTTNAAGNNFETFTRTGSAGHINVSNLDFTVPAYYIN